MITALTLFRCRAAFYGIYTLAGLILVLLGSL